MQLSIGDIIIYTYKFEKGCNCAGRKSSIERTFTLHIKTESDLEIVSNLLNSPNFVKAEKQIKQTKDE
jgi:hypothetical protein